MTAKYPDPKNRSARELAEVILALLDDQSDRTARVAELGASLAELVLLQARRDDKMAQGLCEVWEMAAGGECDHGIGTNDCAATDGDTPCMFNAIRPLLREAYKIVPPPAPAPTPPAPRPCLACAREECAAAGFGGIDRRQSGHTCGRVVHDWVVAESCPVFLNAPEASVEAHTTSPKAVEVTCPECLGVLARLAVKQFNAQVTVDGGAPVTSEEFFRDNELLPPEEAISICVLKPGESVTVGGGAAPTFTVRRPFTVEVKVGDRVRFKAGATTPIFNYELDIGGRMGVVVTYEPNLLAIKLDTAFPISDLDEWDNEIQFVLPEDAASAEWLLTRWTEKV